MQNKKGSLYLIPSLLGESQPLTVLPLSVKAAIEKIDYYIVEHEKDARRFIKSIASHKKQSNLHFEQINKFTKEEEIPHMLSPRSEEHTSELQLRSHLVCRLLLEKKK